MPMQEIDTSRAILEDEDMFKPLVVDKTSRLDDALNHNQVKADTDLLLLAHPTQPLALIKGQMAYHHVAQGKINGEPWMVSF